MIKKIANAPLSHFGLEIRRKHQDFYLHEYHSYEDYKKTQILHNKRKINNVWADEATLDLVINRVKKEFQSRNEKMFGLCHGTRNGFEQNYIASKIDCDIIGTDISETATQFPLSVQWDFHDQNDKWIEKCDFIYTNSLDQSWKPREALITWLEQLKLGGLLIIEHTEAHGPQGSGEMDPFGATPQYMPYLLADWFKHAVAVEIIEAIKPNTKSPVWLFVVKKLATPHQKKSDELIKST